LAFDVLIVGAGAAGLMCAISAGRRGRRVMVLDHADEPGKKILISGGGRCNFTNLGTAPERFFSDNRHFCKSALARFPPADFVALVERHGIAFHEKTFGQLFCDGSARAIVAMLLAECAAVGVALRLGCRVGTIGKGERFSVATDQGLFEAGSVVMASGGLSIPKLGATGFAYEVARRFGMAVVAPRPGLVPLTFGGAELAVMQGLSGVGLPVVVACGRARFAEAMLFTHRGLSGPAVLQISSVWREGAAIAVELAPGLDVGAFLIGRKQARPNAEARTVLAEILPQRLAERMTAAHLPARAMAGQTDRDLNGLAAVLKRWRLVPSGSEGFAKAEVTVGGVDTAGLSSRTMEAKAVPGLFFVGEAVDVTGWLGGYNFQWAWSSGWVAGQAV
jgi:predicted Rossmann fold flavoprotein